MGTSSRPMKFCKERSLQLAVTVIVCIEGFQNLVQTLKEEGPEAVDRSKSTYELWQVRRVVVIWLHRRFSIEL